MNSIVIATTNPDKLREIRHVLADTPVVVRSLAEFPPVVEPEETGATFAENARLKALAYEVLLGGGEGDVRPAHARLIVAEDSGLEIDALEGEPGVRSARFLRPDATYPERFDEIARRLGSVPDRPRTARFVCAVAAVEAGRVVFETMGTVEGEIVTPARGTAGFGYDPIFYYPPYGRTLAEVTEPEKVAVAHRGRAFRELARWLAQRQQR